MKCDQCDNEATVHEVMIKGGKKKERHLCEKCARQIGVSITTQSTPITQLLTQFMANPPVAEAGAAESISGAKGTDGQKGPTKIVNVCPKCGLGYAQFRSNGLVGCPDCYSSFEGQLTPLLSRAHEGGTHHTGKRPRRLREQPAGLGAEELHAQSPKRDVAQADAELERQSKIAATRRRLGEAVAAEQYELAAKLRDELARLEGRRVSKDDTHARERSGGPRPKASPSTDEQSPKDGEQ